MNAPVPQPPEGVADRALLDIVKGFLLAGFAVFLLAIAGSLLP